MMSSSQSINKSNSAADLKSKKGAKEGKIYEKLSLALLAKNGYELSKCNSKFRNFAIGREVDIGKDGKFDDVVFSYTDQDNTKNLIFVQIKHKQNDYRIDSQVLSTEASKAKSGKEGGMPRDFNLQKYFISYLSVREELKCTASEELKNGNIKYVTIFTNIGLDIKNLNDNGFSLKEAPNDIICLFSLNKSSSNIQDDTCCYQFGNVSEGLRKILLKSSDLHRLARELAQYVIWEDYRENKIMGIDQTPIKYYHVAFEKEVIQKSDQVKNSKKQMKNEQYTEAQFRDDFVDCNKPGSQFQLKNAVFEVIREIDESKQAMTDDELKIILKKIKWKVVPNFGKTKQNIKRGLPYKWITVNEEDIEDFLKCSVFIVNQPSVKELQTFFNISAQDTVIEDTSFAEILNKIGNTGPELRKCIEKALEIDEKIKYKEKWITGENILTFFEYQKQLINLSFIVTSITLLYESEVMKHGKFIKFQQLEDFLDSFLRSDTKILCIKTNATLLSSIKVLQFFNTKKYYTTDDRISIRFDILKSKDIRETIIKAFELKTKNLLTIEYRYTVQEQDMTNFYFKLSSIVNSDPNKKVIFVIPQYEINTITEDFEFAFLTEGQFSLKNDLIDLHDFEPIVDPLKKELIIFQGEKKKVSLFGLTGINCWNSYVEIASQEKYKNMEGGNYERIIADIFNNDEIEIGKKPLGTSNLEGAYATMFEEINVKSFVQKLISPEIENKTNQIYIMSGISELNKEKKLDALIQNLGLFKNHENIKKQIGCDSRIQIVNDQFKDEDFKRVCSDHPDKKVFWIYLKNEENGLKLILQQFYNPTFYIERNFKTVVVTRAVKRQLTSSNLSDIFIFYPVNTSQELINKTNINFDNNCANAKIKYFIRETDARAAFHELSEKNQDQPVHLLKLEEEQFIWCDSCVSLDNLWLSNWDKQTEAPLVEEANFIKEIRDKKVVVIADDPGMGKTTTLTKLYESNRQSKPLIETHWVIRINLKDHIHPVRDVKFVNGTIDVPIVVNFLTKIDVKLNNNLAKSLLRIALDKRKKPLKPLLLAFDGFDEVLDAEDRNKIIELFKFFKKETAAKLWITTRLHYKYTLEKELLTFAIEFEPMNDTVKQTYIEKYLKDRFYLIFSEEEFAEIFLNTDNMEENGIIHNYTKEFLNKMKLVFIDNICRFIGTPLQLYLMLEGSINHFKSWVKNYNNVSLNFYYLGNDIREVYKQFLERKYCIYFKKMGIEEYVRQKEDTFIFTSYSEDLAKSLILKSNSKKVLEKFKDIVLSAGIIISHGSNIEFIHTTFKDYYAAKVFVHWIKKAPYEQFYSFKHEYILKEILKKPDYKLIRTFINLKLKKYAEFDVLEESLKHYGKITEYLFNKKQSPLIDVKGTVLHIAAKENNAYIFRFILDSLKLYKDVFKQFLFTCDKDGRTALHSACNGNVEVLNIKLLLDAAAEISDDTLQEFLHSFDNRKINALDLAIMRNYDNRICEMLLKRANSKLELIMNEHKKYNSLVLASWHRNNDFVINVFKEFEHDEKALNQLLLSKDSTFGSFRYCAVQLSTLIVKDMLSIAKSINDDNETLRKMLLPDEDCYITLLHPAPQVIDKFKVILNDFGDNETLIKKLLPKEYGYITLLHPALKDIDTFKVILNAARGIEDNNYTLKQLFLDNEDGKSLLDSAIRMDCKDVINYLLETTPTFCNEISQRLISLLGKK